MNHYKKALAMIISLIILSSCAPGAATPIQTPIPTVSQVIPPTSTPTATATQTPLPTATPVPPTSTLVPTPDYSQIKLVGAHSISGQYGSFTQVILEMGSLQGEFYGIGGLDNYKCEFRQDIPTQINCIGAPVPTDKLINFSLFISTQTEPVFSTSYRFTGPSPTPAGMYCEIEGLWTDIIKSRGYYAEPGCYAVTCWIDGKYYGGVEDSCIEYWPWIPPGLYPTPLATHTP